MNEIWKDIKDYKGIYQVSNLGRVKSLNYNHTNKNKVIKQYIDKGYLRVVLCSKGKIKNYLVHRLVAQAFILNRKKLQFINHKNEIKTDNRASNLEWCDKEYNLLYGTRVERIKDKNSKKVKCIESGITYKSTNDASRKTNINQSNICQCANGRYRVAGGYHWQYV